MKTKKGVTIFTIDSIIAVSIFAIGIILVFFRISAYQPVQEPGLDAASNLITFLSATKVGDIDWPDIGANPENSIIQQAAEYYHNGRVESAQLLLGSIVPDVVSGIELELSINNELIYFTETAPDDAGLIIPFRKMLYGSTGRGNFWSYVMEIKIWQE
ncbi:hypothetical protein KY337_04685 [Candidatus Woesearchaeota archaeon]|nr:hypothetical protein [Candidatus Woesearchaeota archaeon]